MSPVSDLEVVTSPSENNMTEAMTEFMTSTEPGPADNTTANETYFFIRDETLHNVELAILSIILYLAVFSNGIVLVVLKVRYQQLSRMQWCIAHLAIADLFVAFFHVLPQLIWDATIQFHGNDFLCRMVKLLQVVAMCASSLVLVMTAIDRYISICHPLISQTLSPSRVHQMIALAWVLSFVLSLPQLFIFRLTDMGDGEFQCYGTFIAGWGLKAYITYMFMVVYVIPCLLLAFCYGRICFKVWESMAFKESSSSFRHSTKQKTRGSNGGAHKSFRLRVSFRRMQNQEEVTSHDNQPSCDVDYQIKRMITPPRKPVKRVQTVSKTKIKTVKMTLAVVLTYLFCWAPFFMANMISVFGNVNFQASYMVIIMLLASLNSCTNPWIYLAFSGRMCSRQKERKVSRSYNTSTQLTYACDTLETTTLQHNSLLCVGDDVGDSSGGGGTQRPIVLKDRRRSSSWRQLQSVRS